VNDTHSGGPWGGVDVGSTSKGFDAAIIHGANVVCGPQRFLEPGEAAAWLAAHEPTIVAVDSPPDYAPRGKKLREAEREFLQKRICNIRPTPHLDVLEAHPRLYGWILNGRRLYAALNRRKKDIGWQIIECFPTATWTQIGARRGVRGRAEWSAEILRALRLNGLPNRLNQDARDALGAAHTARLFGRDECYEFRTLVVPRRPVSAT
jgi:predicted nuclease with RNAse H fold